MLGLTLIRSALKGPIHAGSHTDPLSCSESNPSSNEDSHLVHVH